MAAKSGALRGSEIVVGVTGSIAAYKAAEVVSQIVRGGGGGPGHTPPPPTQFVGPLTFQTLTRRRVMIDQFDLESVVDPTHISLTDEADLVAVVPATANFIGKAAHGIADDMLTSLLLAVDCPVLVAPAMNDRMWKHPAVRENIETLRKRGYRFIDPDSGFLACGTYAKGRLADPARIVEEIVRCVS